MENSNQSNPPTPGGESTLAPADQEEHYPEPLSEDVAIGLKWVFWEQYEEPPGINKKPTAEEYNKYMQKIGWFHDYISFWQLWHTLPLKSLEQYFYDKASNQVPIFTVTKEGETSQKRISALAIFQSGIKPQWEDPVNKEGSELRCLLPSLVYKMYNQIWEEIITDLVTKKIPHADEIAGIRIFDRSRNDVTIRLDVWLKFAHEHGEKTKAIRAYLVEKVFESHGFQSDIQYSGHK
jgi:hypothetical protein